ncbi:heptaprenylglyceryl phosphate synthase [Listeria fleischmannii]|uniref:Geranylgeranylglyceryl phosphate synthase-like protein n=1 Tax=Listeria fleischmannii FSL S10-1203 TaxID=1265822 RepID=W7DH93_9LIST|nr:heptaprenylglyceryl phosphate synthase [Listeria fleischmannii]EUJ50886.1 geranylgeranylglyceryl phosphate synthase-like protein [Listeria fleischmannii FSL S10-1203]
MRHLFKIDPAKPLSEEAIKRLLQSETDGFIIGGTDEITLENVTETYECFMETDLPLYLEVSTPDMILPLADQFLIPMVLNTRDTTWSHGLHVEILRQYAPHVPFRRLSPVGYVILNKDAKAAIKTGAETNLEAETVAAYAELAEHFFHLPIFYVEYSGMFGDVTILKAAKAVLSETELWYGGGIRSLLDAKKMAEVADVIIVGNLIYEDLEEALATTHVSARASRRGDNMIK